MSKEWSNLATVVYKRTYARRDAGTLENWNDTVSRVIRGNTKDHEVSEKELKDLESLMLDRKAMPAGRGLWFSGAPAHQRLGGGALNNPLHENTKFLTKEHGWTSLKDVEGEEVTVLSSTKLYGREHTNEDSAPIWVKATVSKAEMHPCLKIVYEDKTGISTEVVTSLNHRWFIKNTTKDNWQRVTSEELKVGQYLPKVTPAKNYELSVEGAKHGYFFGDGTRSSGERNHLKIKSIERLEGLHRVLCATVPHYEQFVIEGFCLTSNCWFLTADDWENFILAQDLLMLGGGVGLSVEHRFVSKLPKIKKEVEIYYKNTRDADFIVPDSREGWCELTRKVLESFFVTGKSFSYSTKCLRGSGEIIKGFGGTASGPLPLTNFVEKLCGVLINRQGKHLRPIDAMDVICATGEMVVAGNVRRSAIIILGDPWDKEYLKSKRWDLGPIPTERAMANLSVVCDDIDDLHPLFWKTYEQGEPFGLVNRKNIRKFARMGDQKKDTAIGVNPCAEATLEDGEPCNLQELFLPNFKDEKEFIKAARLMHRWGKRVACEHYHNAKNDRAVKKNRRIGTGITGCLQAPQFFNPEVLDKVYNNIQEENKEYSKKLGIPESIRTTVVKPSGTLSLLGDCTAGIHPSYSDFYIRRVRFSANDPLIPLLKQAGHPMEPVKRFDGSLDHNTVVVDFFCRTPEGTPVADRDFDTWKQLDILKMAQKHWADQAVSVTVYYKKEELNDLKDWLRNNYKYLKTISFLCHSDHGFDQAPLEATDEATYEKMTKKIKNIGDIEVGGEDLDLQDCEGGACPIK